MVDKLKVYFIGYGGNSYMAEELRPMIEELGMTLTTIHEHDNADIKWELHTWLNHLKKADIIISPANYKKQPAKSANRVTQAMSLGKPIICSPLPSYLDIAKKHPGSFLIADTPEEWKENLLLLRDSSSLREQLSKRALGGAQDYSIDTVGNKWLNIFKEVKKEYSSTDIVIPTYKNFQGLRECTDSIIACTTVPYKIIIVNNGDNKDIHEFYSQRAGITYIKKEKLNFAQAVNIGIKAGTSPYVVILNDDVIVSIGWLRYMLDACTHGVGVVGLLSNCDKGWLHRYDINIGGVDLLPGSNTYEQIKPIIGKIYQYKSPYSEIIERDWVAFYATLVPRLVIEKVGYLDEKFTNSGEDVDYCKRIRRLGYRVVQTYKSFVFHFGAVSRKALEGEGKDQYQEADRRTQGYLTEKYSQPTVIVYSGPSWERWSSKSLEEGGIGGSEVWQIHICRGLSDLGYRVVSFNDSPQQEIWEGKIQYLHYNQYPAWCDQNYADYVILSRSTDPLKFPLRAGKIFVMIHDVFLLSPKDQLFLDKVEKFCVLSQWHLDFAHDYHKIPKDKLHITSNGIDFSRFDDVNVKKNPYRLHWSSSWDRGLDNVLYLFPFIKERIPKLELHVYYGSHTWKESCKQKGDQQGLNKIAEIEKGMEREGVFNHGRVGQKELAIAEKEASLWLYPSWFSESFCITGIEMQRAGAPVIANKYAGVITSLGDSALLLGNGDPWWPYSKEGRESFFNETVRLLTDQDEWERWAIRGFQNTFKYSWEQVAVRWKRLFEI